MSSIVIICTETPNLFLMIIRNMFLHMRSGEHNGAKYFHTLVNVGERFAGSFSAMPIPSII